jgi:hypothetical protein
MEETRFGTDDQCLPVASDDITYLEKESRYLDPDVQPLGQERHTQQAEQPW